ncbi:acetylornithine deacetylase [Aestuariivita boseongensis]|uniref:acetylornithine deacetylase n=1 Tax=Aestuariivita boseongensis TaxID=1470562 RepID=UPI000AC8FAD1|nr:acetylornithine deacetylase [Aestuariivita boseongensis]
MSLLEDTVDTLGRLIAYPTVSSDSNLEMIADLALVLEGHGAHVEVFRDPSGSKANLFATLGPDVPGGLVLSGHTDVVPVTDQDWSSDPFALRDEGERLYGRGTCDMKGFIAATLVMAERFAGMDLKRPIHFAFTHDEEVGCIGARALVPELKSRGIAPAMALIGEPTLMRVIEGHKGCCEYTVRFEGLEGHGSNPDVGVSAVEYAARYAARLLALREDLIARTPESSTFQPPWTTLNVGRIAGGSAHNVIAGKAEIDWEMRPVQQADALFVKQIMAEYVDEALLPAMRAVSPDADISTEIIGEVAGLEPATTNQTRDIVMALTGANGADLVPFGTEAGLFQEIGMDVIVCGPGSIDQAHKPDEFITRSELQSCLKLLEQLGQHMTRPTA